MNIQPCEGIFFSMLASRIFGFVGCRGWSPSGEAEAGIVEANGLGMGSLFNDLKHK